MKTKHVIVSHRDSSPGSPVPTLVLSQVLTFSMVARSNKQKVELNAMIGRRRPFRRLYCCYIYICFLPSFLPCLQNFKAHVLGGDVPVCLFTRFTMHPLFYIYAFSLFNTN